jgi:hypothetical protein
MKEVHVASDEPWKMSHDVTQRLDEARQHHGSSHKLINDVGELHAMYADRLGVFQREVKRLVKQGAIQPELLRPMLDVPERRDGSLVSTIE